MQPTLKMLLDSCHDDTREAFQNYIVHKEIRAPTAKDFETLEVILQQACSALASLGCRNLRDVADDMGAAVAKFVIWPTQ